MNTCPCCGYKVFEERGNYEICPICYWEDDDVQLADPWFEGGANTPSLVAAQKNYTKFGSMEQRFQKNTRKATESDEKDSEWRPVDDSDREFITSPREIEEEQKNYKSIPYEYWKRNA